MGDIYNIERNTQNINGATLNTGSGGGAFGNGIAAADPMSKIASLVNGLGKLASEAIRFSTKINTLNANLDVARKELEGIANKFRNLAQKTNLETAFNNQIAHMETFMRETENLTRASFKAISEGFNKGAYAAYNAMVGYNTSVAKLNLQIKLNEQKQGIELYRQRRKRENEEFKKTNEIRNKELEKEITYAQGGAAMASRVTGTIGGMIPGVGQIVSAAGNAASDVVSTGADATLRRQKNMLRVAETNMRVEFENLEEQLNNYVVVVDKEKEIEEKKLAFQAEMLKIFAEFAQSSEGWMTEFNKNATNFVRQYGYMGGQLERYKDANTVGGISSWSVGAKTSATDVAAYQLAYQLATGRNTRLDEMDVYRSSLLDRYAGENGFNGKIASELQVFGGSFSSASNMMLKRMVSLERSGLSARKYAKDIEKYVWLANKYNFNGGVDALSKMVAYSQKMRFNMEHLGGAMDKFSGPDISSALENAARLNVLGGNAALYGDPIGMMYDAVMDPEGFSKRMMAMMSEYGTMENGQMKYDFAGTQIMKAYSDIMGEPVEDIRKRNFEAEKRRQISGLMSGSGITGDNLDFLIANSSWSEELGTWAATVGNSKRSVSGLKTGDLKGIVPETTEDRIEDMMRNIRSIREVINPFLSLEEREQFKTSENHLKVTQDLYGLFKGEFAERMGKMDEYYNEMIGKYGPNIAQAMIDATASMTQIGAALDTSTWQKDVTEHLESIKNDIEALREHFAPEVKSLADANGFTEEMDYYAKAGKGVKVVEGVVNTAIVRSGRELMGEYNKANAPQVDLEMVKSVLEANGETLTVNQDAFTTGSMYSPSTMSVTSPKDVNMSWQKGGPLDTLFNGVAGKVNVIGDFVDRVSGGGSSSEGNTQRKMDVNVIFGGRAELSCNGNKVSLGDLIAGDPFVMRKISEMVLTEISKYNDGRGAVNAYTNVGNIFA